MHFHSFKHKFNKKKHTDSPCLSFDVIKDELGENRSQYPHTCYIVSGTQAETASSNNLIVMKMSNLRKTFKVSHFSFFCCAIFI